MIKDIIAFCDLFADRVPDQEIHQRVRDLISDEQRWTSAHDLFAEVRDRTLTAISRKDESAEAQYLFSEACLKGVWNETDTDAPFDSDSPYWIAKCAIQLARQLGVPDERVIDIIAS